MDAADREERRSALQKIPFSTICFNAFCCHPLDHARFLAQIGHEPLSGYLHRTMFGKECIRRPNLIKYAKYIYSVNGFDGLYVGLLPKTLGNCIEVFSFVYLSDFIELDRDGNGDGQDSNLKKWKNCALTTSKEMLCTTISIILSHPFHVVSMRMMAQFIGQEQRYTSVLSSLLFINQEQGFKGLFAGIVPRLLCGLGTIFLANMIKQAIACYLFSPSTITYEVFDNAVEYFTYKYYSSPLTIVTACSAINNSGLACGMPPDMPVFGNWLECMRYLYKLDHLDRGSSIFFRNSPLTKLAF